MSALANRYDFVLLFDVSKGNPNGDPDAGNLPRLDPETNHGFVSDVSLKRKVRNYVEFALEGQAGYDIYVKQGAVLNEKHREAYRSVRQGDDKVGRAERLNPRDDDEQVRLRDYMCETFFDVRAFGAVMSTGINCGQVRGPVQLAFAYSAEPIVPQEIVFTRMAATTESARKGAAGDSDERIENRTMGRKYIVPYGLYRAHGFVSARLAGRTGFDQDDLAVLFEALTLMFDHDRSASRGEMATRKLIVFKHASALGNAPAHALFDRVRVGRNIDGVFRPIDRRLDNYPPARAFSDYVVEIDRTDLPRGVEILDLA